MPEVSFYLLETASAQDINLFACKLIEKAYRGGHYCYVLTDSDEQSKVMDDLLWTFRAGSFIPHQIYAGSSPESEQVVLIGYIDPPVNRQNYLINLSSRFPQSLERAERVLELINNTEASKAAGRARYRHYRQADWVINTHQIKY